MRWVLLSIMLFAGGLAAQFQPTPVNFGKLNYEVSGERLAQSDLEQILNTFASFGDQNVLLREVLNGMIIYQDDGFSDSLFHFWYSDYSAEDSIRLSQLPAVSENFRERAFLTFRFTIFAKAFNGQTSWIQEAMKMIGQQSTHFPHLPEGDQYPDAALSMAYDYYNYSQWCLQYPGECDYFVENLMQQVAIRYPDSPETQLTLFIAEMEEDLLASRSIYKVYWTASLEEIRDYLSDRSVKNATLLHADLCTPENLEKFLTEAYHTVYHEDINKNTLDELQDFIVKNELYDPQMIYIALIRHRYE